MQAPWPLAGLRVLDLSLEISGPYATKMLADAGAHWAGVRRALADPEWARDPGLAERGGRRRAHDAIDARLGDWCRERSAEDAARALLAEGVPAAPLVNAHHISRNPQLAHRGYFHELEHPVAGRIRYPLPPFRFSDLDLSARRTPPPTIGQHNEEILCGELGLGRDELERLRERQVIGTRPAFDV